MKKLPWAPRAALLATVIATALAAQEAMAAPVPCTDGARVTPSGQTGGDIQDAISRAPRGATVILSGVYEVDRAIRLGDGMGLCSEKGATLHWARATRNGMMVEAMSSTNTRVLNLVLDGRGVMVRGRGHRIENNIFTNINSTSADHKHWGHRLGVFIVDHGEALVIRGNRFQNVIETGIMGYGLRDSVIAENHFVDTAEGIHLWDSGSTRIEHNTGQGFTAMAIETQGKDDLPGFVVQGNNFGLWAAGVAPGYYAMSIVNAKGSVIKDNTITAAPGMKATALEVGGDSPLVTGNKFNNAGIVIAVALGDVVIDKNTLVNAPLVKDINEVRGRTLTISGNTITNAPTAAIRIDRWEGYEAIVVKGNVITKSLSKQPGDFYGILVGGTRRKPLQIIGNAITISGGGGGRASCLFNVGHQGDMKDALIANNACEGGGIASFSESNSSGGHQGIIYRQNTLSNLRAGITGDSSGLIPDKNSLRNVATDRAGLDR